MDHDASLDAALGRARTRRRLPTPLARRLLREQAGLSQADVAGPLGVTPTCISRWETGHRSPRDPALAEAYAALLQRLAAEGAR